MAVYPVTLLEKMRADLGDLDGAYFASAADLTELLDEFNGDYEMAVWRGLLRAAAAMATVNQYAAGQNPDVAKAKFEMRMALLKAWGKPIGAMPTANEHTLIVGGITKRVAEEAGY